MFEKLDKTDIKVLRFIADKPFTKFYLREISKKLKISPSSVKKALDRLIELNLIKSENFGNLRIVYGNIDEILFKQYKILTNVEFVNPIVKELLPATGIILYGSYAKGENDEDSDIDIIVIGNKKPKNILSWKEKKIQIKFFKPYEWDEQIKKNKAYHKEVKKGILLYGDVK